jgi:hypothetical protein
MLKVSKKNPESVALRVLRDEQEVLQKFFFKYKT